MAKYSLLSRKEEKRNMRRATFFTLLTIACAIAIIVWGIPSLIKMAVFFGNIKSSSTPIEKTNNLPPSPPFLNALPEATNSAELNISGLAAEGLTIKIFLTGSEAQEIVTDKDGKFSTNELKLTLGNNEIYALAVDQEGNQSAPSEKISVWYENKPPELEVSQPADKTVISNEKGKVEIIGKANPEANVQINEHLVILDKDGNFKYSLNLSVGENNIKIIAKDKAGNQTEKSLMVSYSP